ncbi:MAG TPA: FecR family protein [Burkholderiales bacterium]|nr:FecR family protein [Burkholderiales bacterium]
MPQEHFSLNCRAALLAAIAAAYPVVGYSAPAARVDFAIGNVTATGAGGQSRPIGKGAPIEQGDTINTNGGRAQLRFTDGAYVSLQPESQFRIDQYRYEGKQDGSEKGFFSLLKGGLRTITGLVGRTNKGNYQVTTSVATIGIRGTEYTIEYGHSVTGTVGEGEINVCNGGGCLSVMNGESYYVQGQEVKPVITNKRTDLPPPPPESPPPQFKQGEAVNSSGYNCDIVGCGSILTGTVKPAHVGIAGASGANVYDSTRANLDALGRMTDFDDNVGAVTLRNPVSVGNDGVIAWGTASGATGGECCIFNADQVLHYVAGIPTTDFTALGGMQATYTLLGATNPTSVNTGAVAGTLNSMTMIADFLGGSNANVKGTMSWTLLNQALSATFSGGTDGAAFFASGPTSFSGSVSLTGFFAGANAARAGVVYNVFDSSIASQDSFAGAAALTQSSVAPLWNVGIANAEITSQVVTFTGTSFSSGLLTQFSDGVGAVSVSGPVATSGNDGIIAWGRASSATGGECCSGGTLHYVAGIPTSDANMTALGGTTGTYTLLGATQPTSTSTGAVAGTLNSMAMSVNFLGAQNANINGSANWTLASQSVSATFSGGMCGGTFFATGNTTSGFVNLQGYFAGTNAARAGVVYNVNDLAVSSDTFVGAAALKQTSLVPTQAH